MAKKTSGIYALIDPVSKETRYIGQSSDVKNRYRQHLKDFYGDTPKERWIMKLNNLGLSPEMILIEETQDLDVREEYWIRNIREEGNNLLNIADGGKSVRHMNRGKKEMPWGTKRSPIQAIISKISKTARDLGDDALSNKAKECRKASKQMQKAGNKTWILANMMLLNEFEHLQKEYAEHIDMSKVVKALS